MNELQSIAGVVPIEPDFDLFGDLEPDDPVDVKLEQLGAHLAALLVLSGRSRTDAAQVLNLSKSRITKLLSGQANPTVGTVFRYCLALGFDADVIFRQHSEHRSRQPWENISHQPDFLAHGVQHRRVESSGSTFLDVWSEKFLCSDDTFKLMRSQNRG